MTDDIETPEIQPTGGETPPETGAETPEVSPISEPETDEFLAALEDLEKEESPEEKPVKKARFQKRISELTTKRKDLEREASELREKLAYEKARADLLAQQQRSAAATPPPQAEVAPTIPPPVLPPKPQRADFYNEEDPDGAFIEAMADYKAEVKFRTEQHRQEQERAKEQQETQRRKGMDFVQRVSATYPDFLSQVQASGNPSPTVAGAIMTIDQGKPEVAMKVAYYLAKNPAEMARVNNMSPNEAFLAIGQMAAEISATPPTKAKTTTTTPPPITPPTPTGTPVEVDVTKMSTAEYIEYANRMEFGGGE